MFDVTSQCTCDFIFVSAQCLLQLNKKMLKDTFPLLFSLLPSLVLSARKNVLFIGSDDMRPNLNLYSDVTEGVFASPTMHTPNLDKVEKSQNSVFF